ncbi:MAG: ATP-binding protein [Syntrophus sp. (in: bacteria)]
MKAVSVELTIRFLQNLSYLHLVTGASRLLCETIKELNLSSSLVDEVELAVSEACTNAIRHGADAAESAMVIVSFHMSETQLVIEVSDQGAGFNFEEVPQPAFDQHPEGGYGLYIIQKMMDEVQYKRGSEMNTLTMKKNLRIKG